MKALIATTLVLLTLPLAAATHDSGCPLASAPPGSYNTIGVTVNGFSETFYIEERDGIHLTGVPIIGSAAVPLSGFLIGNGTWIYQESNGIPGLQRGATGWLFDYFPPGCDQAWEPGNPTVPCLFVNENPIIDYTCGHATDTIVI